MSAVFFGEQFVQFYFAETRHYQHLYKKEKKNQFRKTTLPLSGSKKNYNLDAKYQLDAYKKFVIKTKASNYLN